MEKDALVGLISYQRTKNIVCPPYPRKHTGSCCLRPVHVERSLNLERIPCNETYHYIYMCDSYGILQWVIVIGAGEHLHAWNFAKEQPIFVKEFVLDSRDTHGSLTPRQISLVVAEKFRTRAPLRMIEGLRYRHCMKMFLLGRTLQELLFTLHHKKYDYLYYRKYLSVEGEEEKTQPTSRQVKIEHRYVELFFAEPGMS